MNTLSSVSKKPGAVQELHLLSKHVRGWPQTYGLIGP